MSLDERLRAGLRGDAPQPDAADALPRVLALARRRRRASLLVNAGAAAAVCGVATLAALQLLTRVTPPDWRMWSPEPHEVRVVAMRSMSDAAAVAEARAQQEGRFTSIALHGQRCQSTSLGGVRAEYPDPVVWDRAPDAAPIWACDFETAEAKAPRWLRVLVWGLPGSDSTWTFRHSFRPELPPPFGTLTPPRRACSTHPEDISPEAWEALGAEGPLRRLDEPVRALRRVAAPGSVVIVTVQTLKFVNAVQIEDGRVTATFDVYESAESGWTAVERGSRTTCLDGDPPE